MDDLPSRQRPSPVTWKTIGSMAVLLVCFLLMTSSGRVGSSDAGSQLDAALLWVRTGKVHAPEPFGVDPEMWVRSPTGVFYQAHDIGALLLLIPAAKFGTMFVEPGYNPLRDPPPLTAKVLASLSYTMMAAGGALCFFLLLRLFIDTRRSTLLTLTFVTATMYWAYSKTAWDVMGGCVGVALLLFITATIVCRSGRRTGVSPWIYAAAGLAFAIACSFRYSLMPFLGIAIIVLAVLRRSAFPRRAIVFASLALLVSLLPALYFNQWDCFEKVERERGAF